MGKILNREEAWELVCKYNQDPFHRKHAKTVGCVLGWYAKKLGYGDEAEFWEVVGILHDIDFELYPEEHCIKAKEMLAEHDVDEKIIHGVVCHAYGLHDGLDTAPEHQMEKVLFAADELTGLIGAAALMRPSKSVSDMELKSLKKKFKDKKFAAGCSRPVIEQGAQMLGWELDELLSKTLDAMRDCEEEINSIG